MVSTDVPKWYNRYLADQAAGTVYLSGNAGLEDSIYTQHATQAYSSWSGELFPRPTKA